MTRALWSVRGVVADLRARGDKPCIVAFTADGPESWSAARLAQVVERLSAGLRDQGMAVGDRIALWGPNSAAWVAVAVATMGVGAVLVPIDDLATADEAARLLARSNATLLITTRRHAEALSADVSAGLKEIYLLDDHSEGAALRGWRSLMSRRPEDLPQIPSTTPAALLATSGTTGDPKLFLLTHGNLGVNIRALIDEGIVTGTDRALVPLPLHHIYPLVVGMLISLSVGITIVFPEWLSGPHMLAALREAGVTIIIGVPRLYEALLSGLRARLSDQSHLLNWLFDRCLAFSRAIRSRLQIEAGKLVFAPVRRRIGPKLRLLVSGGAHLPASLQSDLEALGWQVLPGYGLAETASVFTVMRPGERRDGSAGRVLPDREIRIDAPDDAGVGEILLRGPSVAEAYLNVPQASVAAFTADGWFRTGDLGYLDSDGFLFIVGRLSEMIALGGGKKVNPEDLEKAYAACPFVEEIAIMERAGKLVALARPRAEALKAIHVVEPRQPIEVGLAEIMQGLPSHERLTGIAIAGEPLPRTRLGKLRRFMLPECYERALSDSPAKSTDEPTGEAASAIETLGGDEIGHAVLAFLRERYPGRALRLDGNPSLDLGLDSLAWMDVTMELERRLGLNLADAGLAEATTLSELIERVRRVEAGPVPPDGVAAGRPSVTEADRWIGRKGWMSGLARALLLAINRLIVQGYFGLQASGTGNLPERGPFVITPNHVSDLDPLAIAAALPRATRNRTYWSGTAGRLFQNRISRLFWRLMNVFPVEELKPQAAIDMAARVLARRDVVVWFPEGWRSPDGRLQTFRPGIGALLLQTDALVVPAHIEGTFAAMPRTSRFPRPNRLRVVFGDPVTVRDLTADASETDQTVGVAAALRERVAALATARRPMATADPP